MKPTRKPGRGLRVADQIQRDLAEMIQREVPTERAGLVTLTGVEVSPDYAHARVYFTTIGAPVEAAQRVLNEKAGYFHSLLFKRLSIHTIPHLVFVHDESVERGIEIDRLIDEANRGQGRWGPVDAVGKARGDLVDGVLLLDKPGGMSSNHALQKARKLLNAAKAGHTGTLDPMATGLLPMTFGEATKFSADLLNADKAYRATLKLGVATTTGDVEGEVIGNAAVDASDETIDAALSRFDGTIEQVPPMHSALKRDGRPLYELARAGVEVERAPRQVVIRSLRRVERAGDMLVLDVECSKGTYVRVLAEDIGKALGCGAHLTALRRTRVGPLGLEKSVTLEDLEPMTVEARRAVLRPIDGLLGSLPKVVLDEGLAGRFRQGQRLAINAEPREARVRVYAANDELLGTANVNEWGVVAPERLISNEKVTS